jgi:hypothetical protein
MSGAKQGIPEWFLNKYPKHKLDKLFTSDEGFGFTFFWEFLNLSAHLFIMGSTRSGKTEKKQSVQWWLSRLETIIEFDSGKPGDIEAYFDSPNPDTKFNSPVQVLIPWGCQFDIQGVPKDLEYKITPIMAPEQFFDNIEPGWINIISLRNYFLEEKNLKRYLIQIFNRFDQRARLGEFNRFCPCTMSFEEAHSMMGTQSISTDIESIILTQFLSKWQREMAACRIRNLIITQRFKDVPGPIRENSPCYIVCRGINVENSDHPLIHWLSGFARKALPRQGWWIIDGRHFYSDRPMRFPHFEIPPNIKITYSGFDDGEKDLETEELFPALGRLTNLSQTDLIRSSLAREDLPEDLPDLGIYSKFIPKRTGVKNAI